MSFMISELWIQPMTTTEVELALPRFPYYIVSSLNMPYEIQMCTKRKSGETCHSEYYTSGT